MQPEICNAGVLPVLLRLMIYCKNSLILIQCCKLVISLTKHPPNQILVTSTGVFHGVIDLIDAVSSGADRDVRMLACAAATNITFHRCDATRPDATLPPHLSTSVTSSYIVWCLPHSHPH